VAGEALPRQVPARKAEIVSALLKSPSNIHMLKLPKLPSNIHMIAIDP
jgi:hypothetical protein